MHQWVCTEKRYNQAGGFSSLWTLSTKAFTSLKILSVTKKCKELQKIYELRKSFKGKPSLRMYPSLLNVEFEIDINVN